MIGVEEGVGGGDVGKGGGYSGAAGEREQKVVEQAGKSVGVRGSRGHFYNRRRIYIYVHAL